MENNHLLDLSSRRRHLVQNPATSFRCSTSSGLSEPNPNLKPSKISLALSTKFPPLKIHEGFECVQCGYTMLSKTLSRNTNARVIEMTQSIVIFRTSNCSFGTPSPKALLESSI